MDIDIESEGRWFNMLTMLADFAHAQSVEELSIDLYLCERERVEQHGYHAHYTKGFAPIGLLTIRFR